jgi:hypothetical protein
MGIIEAFLLIAMIARHDWDEATRDREWCESLNDWYTVWAGWEVCRGR